MADLNYLKKQYNYWNGQVSSINSKIKKQKNRKNDLEDVLQTIKKVSNGNASDINKRLKSCMGELDGAIDYSGNDWKLAAIFNGKTDAGDDDSDISAASASVQSEFNAANRKIEELNRDLNYAKSKANEYRAAVSAEERRRNAERLKNIFGG